MDKFLTSWSSGAKRKLSSSRDVKSMTASKPKKATLNQTYLDLGQRDFGKSVTCPLCGCLYIQGDMDDEATHQAFCKQKKKGLCLTTLRGHNVCTKLEGDRKVVEVLAGSHKSGLGDIQTALKTVRDELGSQAEFNAGDAADGVKYYLYLVGLSIRGVAVVETVNSKHVVRLSNTRRTCHVMTKAVGSSEGTLAGEKGSELDDSPLGSLCGRNPVAVVEQGKGKNEGDEEDEDEENNREQGGEGEGKGEERHVDHEESVLGISMIWVDDGWRRKGVAAQLCDTARRRFMFGTVVNRSQVAFSQPTEAGHAFALSYAGSNQGAGSIGASERSYLAYH